MLSVFGLANSGGAASYYEQDNYYAKDDPDAMENSEWFGLGAKNLGLYGKVDVDRFTELLDGKIDEKTQVGRKVDGEIQHYSGWDLTFSAPKSVSILALQGKDESLIKAHNYAVNKTLHKIQNENLFTRGKVDNKVQRIQTKTMVAALFRHDVSRELDPQLHTHSVVMNLTENNDSWRSVDGKALFENKMKYGLIYRSILAEKVRALGHDIRVTHDDGRFEISSVPQEVIKAMSKRREQIENALQAKGFDGAVPSSVAALDTRNAKVDYDREQLDTYWNDQLKSLGFDPSNVSVSSQTQDLPKDEILEQSIDFSIRHVYERDAVATRDQLASAALIHKFGRVSLDDIEKKIDEYIDKGKLIDTRYKIDTDRQGNAVYGLTTPEKFAEETKLLQHLYRNQEILPSLYHGEDLDHSLTEKGLNTGQKLAADLILTSKDRYVGVQGLAGTGKTFMLNSVNEVIKESTAIEAFAPSYTAANEIQKSTGINAAVTAHLLTRLKAGVYERPESSKELLWIVDEAGLLDTVDTNDLMKYAEIHNARIAFVGDTKQLASLGAGKAFNVLQQAKMKTAIISKIMRQKDAATKQAVMSSLVADAKGAFKHIENISHEKGKDSGISVISDKTERLKAMADNYLKLSVEERSNTLVITPPNSDRVSVSGMIRNGLMKEGQVKNEGQLTKILVNRHLTTAQTGDANYYNEGDVVKFNLSSYARLGIEKGGYAVVEKIDHKSGDVVLKNENGESVTWKPYLSAGNRKGGVSVFRSELRHLSQGDSLRWTGNNKEIGAKTSHTAAVLNTDDHHANVKMSDGSIANVNLDEYKNMHWDYSYSSTLFAAQGATVDRVIGLADSKSPLLSRNAFYTTISRARYGVSLYVDDSQKVFDTISNRTGENFSAYESLASTKDKLSDIITKDNGIKNNSDRGMSR